eukprot:gnl/MRDRNA2_/MRDRNA2_129945_c0_seq1.p1 gnl/MRDRNA2_/MRDRNA2_129945_c0~~gnl/MRDRNA2_/MRDRNA2_129945_c0_seq1.p1  ORF type:complete len:453 (+),score=81.06 gnl/MRDRNA2_/MRDRNA2_129945_c0_seq1:24-1361(+)
MMPGEIIAAIPEKCMLTLDTMNASRSSLSGDQFDPVIQLGFLLAEQRLLGEASWWAPFLTLLPSLEDFKESLPLAAIALQTSSRSRTLPSSIADFEGIDMFATVWETEASLRRAFTAYQEHALKAPAPETQAKYKLTWEDVVWGASVVSTRTFTLADVNGGRGLVPMIDFVNTAFTPDGGGGEHSTEWHQHLEDRHFMLRAAVELVKGRELTARYFWESSHSHTLRQWGFLGGAQSWRDSAAPLHENCGKWLAARTDTSQLAKNLAVIARAQCAGNFEIMLGRVFAKLQTFAVWLRYLWDGDYRCILRGLDVVLKVYRRYAGLPETTTMGPQIWDTRRRAQIFVKGKVQGVHYRDSTKLKADILGLVGAAWNLNDGRVEIIAEGKKGKLEELVEWCWKGPEGAAEVGFKNALSAKRKVTHVDVVWSDAKGNLGPGFKNAGNKRAS